MLFRSLQRRLTAGLQQHGLTAAELNGPDFLTPAAVFDELAQRKQKWFFTDFYMSQRKRLKILVDDSGKPEGGKWSFDPENRSRLPKDCHVPQISWPQPAAASSEILAAARRWVTSEFPGAPGNPDDFHYPITRRQALTTLQDFLQQRFEHFGLYEDAIHDQQTFLFHSVLTPALNIGLLSPAEIVESALQYADRVPLNSLEGFLRQVIGWREYMRGVYRHFGRRQRTTNFWGHQRALPASFYDGTTGIEPVDTVIRRVQQHAWCHHIERLMILGSFMLLCEFSPDAVYQWFMELFIDAYDWVMVPNIIGMAPSNEDELQDMMFTATLQKRPVAIRYPRGNAEGVPVKDIPRQVDIGKAEVVRHFAGNGRRKVTLFGLGPMLRLARQAAEELAANGCDVAVVNPLFFKPLDAAVHEFFGKASSVVATLEDHVAMGGYGSAVLECLNAAGVRVPVVMLAWPDVFVEHASSVDELRKRHGMTVPALVSRVLEQLEQQEARQDVEIRSRGVAVAG